MFRVLSARPPSRWSGLDAERDSVRHLQELYAVTAGLALTIGVERALPEEGQGHVLASVGLVFFGFVSTLVPFYHGALRHLDTTYVQRAEPPTRGGWLFFGDFLFLFVEACLLVAMGASVASAHRFITVWELLLLLDIAWLLFFVEASIRLGTIERSPIKWHDYGWAVVNVPAALLGAILLPWLTEEHRSHMAGAILAAVLTVARTSADYAWNWHLYFPAFSSTER